MTMPEVLTTGRSNSFMAPAAGTWQSEDLIAKDDKNEPWQM